ncbi:MAG TPA: GntR family transcriptional regulator [Chloroflexota bacterium]|nr:GntR family transcriptional regulator [Chloroflexota bacterium]
MVQSLIFEQLPREQSRHRLVVQRLTDAIAQGRLAVGAHLPSERELCEQLGVSRTIVREAIRVLTSQGILTVQQGRRAVVTRDLSGTDARPMRQFIQDAARETLGDVLDARLILEVASAERAAQQATADDIAELASSLEALRAVPPRSAAAEQAHSAFHRAVARASHNSFLVHMVDSLLDVHVEHVQTAEEDARDMPLLPLGYEAHARIFRPIRDRRVAVARRAMHEHLSTTIQHHPDLHH